MVGSPCTVCRLQCSVVCVKKVPLSVGVRSAACSAARINGTALLRHNVCVAITFIGAKNVASTVSGRILLMSIGAQ